MRDSLVGSITIAVSAGAAVAAFLLSPLLRFADPGNLIISALTLAIGIAVTYVAHVRNWPEEVRLLSVVPISIAVTLASMELADVTVSAIANDRRCLAIQRDMLSAQPRRTDGPDLFQALGCRPQGEGSVYAPPKA